MTTREFDPARLDVAAFAKEAGELTGRWPLAQLLRLLDSAVVDSIADPGDESRSEGQRADRGQESAVTWSARGEDRLSRGTEHQTWLHLRARAPIELECQRCLAPVHCDLEVDRHFLFVHGEETAARLDEESEDDVLALTRALDLAALIEDELLLTLPLVPRHDVCPEPLLPPPTPDASETDLPVNPFAALAALKAGGGSTR